ncbi:MAG: copper resistance protein CopD [Haloferacaceae archaeon]
MGLALALSYVIHVVSAGFWTGGTLFVAYAILPAAEEGDLSAAAFERNVDGLLGVTRWTGLALPATGAYQIWVLYPLPRLVGTTAGHLVLGMLGLWGVMNTLIELGGYRMRAAGREAPGLGAYMAEGFVLGADADVARHATVGRPYLLAAAGLAVLLLADAALLAAGIVR